MRLFLGIDLGTSYFKVGVFDALGEARGLARMAVEPSVRALGQAELPVDTFWQLLSAGVASALAKAGASATQVAGVSYSSQANSFVLLDANDQPLTPLVIWTDERASGTDSTLEAFSNTPAFGAATGFTGMNHLWAAAKWRWFQQQRAPLWRQTRHIMTMSDYFTFALTGERVGDAGTASLLGLYELATGDWWQPVLERIEVDRSQLSEPLRPGTPAGRTVACSRLLLGLPPGIPVAVGGIDHQVAALGSGLGRLADVSISTGTVLAAMALVDKPVAWPGCYHGPHFGPGEFYRLAFNAAGAGGLETLQKRYFPDHTVGTMIEACYRVKGADGSRAGGNPAKQQVRDLLLSIARTHQRLIGQVSNPARLRKVVATGGGARSAIWLQMKADCFGLPVIIPASAERACLGAAMLAGVAAGEFSNIITAAAAMVRAGAEVQPRNRAGVQDSKNSWDP